MRYRKEWTRKYSTVYSDICVRAITAEVSHLIPYTLKSLIMYSKNINTSFCVEDNDFNIMFNKIGEYYSNENHFSEFIEMFHKTGREHVDLAFKLSNTQFKSREKMKNAFKQFVLKWRDYTALLWIGHMTNTYFSDKVHKLVKEKSDLNNFHVLIHPEKKCCMSLFHEKIKNGVNIDKLYEEFKWIPCLNPYDEPWTKDDVKRYVEDFEFKDMDNPDRDSILDKYSDPEKQLINNARELTYIKDKRDEYRRMGMYNAKHFFKMLADEMNLSIYDFSFLMVKEILGPFSKQEIEKRKKTFLISPGKETVCTSDPAEIRSILKKLNYSDVDESSDLISGQGASEGIVKGSVNVIKNKQDLNNFTKGNILVSVTTHPEYVPAMRKASAIVTDEGGMTCHAAIVSRELGIPCVVGTKIATKLLNDGDIVEVDADKGNVRLIEENENN